MTQEVNTAWGRVAEDGTVYVKTSSGERPVGQWPDGDPNEALAFFVKRYEGLVLEVELLETRVKGGSLPPDEAAAAMRKVRKLVAHAQAVGDLEGLLARVDALESVVEERREEKRAARARKLDEARQRKETIAEEAESISAGSDWRHGANRLRELLEEWKSLPRIDKSSDDALWRRFSSARTTYTRRRKQHFAELNEKRDAVRVIKEKLADEAEGLADSTDWGATAARFRDLMRDWKAAGPAPRAVDDQLWARFRAAQDKFFAARDAANAEQEKEFSANQAAKEQLLQEAEALLPVSDPEAARAAFRDIAKRWDAVGKVPRNAVKTLEGRLRKVEQAIKSSQEDRWRRDNPEARARAADTVAQLESSIADLEKQRQRAADAGNTRKVQEVDSAIAARQAWLDQARKALDEFSPGS